MMYRYLAIILVLLVSQVHAEPLSLSVNQISKDLAAEVVDIRVIELHESGKDKTNAVTSSGVGGKPIKSNVAGWLPQYC